MEVCVDSVESAVNAERGGRLCEHCCASSIKPTITCLLKVKTVRQAVQPESKGAKVAANQTPFQHCLTQTLFPVLIKLTCSVVSFLKGPWTLILHKGAV